MTSKSEKNWQQDERLHPRFEGQLEAHLLVDGAWWHCRIRDLSLGGAGLEPAIPAALGREVELRSPRFDFEGNLRGRVVNLAQQRTCIAFDLDSNTRRQLTEFLGAKVAAL